MFQRLVCVFLLTAAIAAVNVNAWSSSMSSFGGSKSFAASIPQNGCNMEMKKGKANVPPQMRGQYKRQQEMANMKSEMEAASKPGSDGFPVFNLFVRTKKQNIWYPCGSFKGDDRSAALAKGYSEGGMMSGVSKKQLDGGIAGSLASDLPKLKETVCRAYPQLRKSRDAFEFGYKLAYQGLAEDLAKQIHNVEPKENKGVLDGIKNMFN